MRFVVIREGITGTYRAARFQGSQDKLASIEYDSIENSI